MKPIARLALLAAVACAPAEAQFFPPIDIEFGAFPVDVNLRCWYRAPKPGNPLAAAYVDAEKFVLRGHWADISASLSSNLFFTEQRPSQMRSACERTLANKGIEETLVQWNAATNALSYNHQVWSTASLSPGAPVDRIVAFGDSLSDTGNIYNDLQWTFPASRSWFLGRFSNGPVWTEYLADMAGKPLQTWAIGGAETKDSNVFINGLDSQVASFRKYIAMAGKYDISRTVFTVLAGANDFMNDRSRDIKSVFAATERLENGLNMLVDLGARKIVLLNLPDISRTPAFGGDPGEALLIHDKTRLYNETIPHVARRLNSRPGTEVVIVDMAGMFEEVLKQPDAFGFGNVTHSCLDMPEDNKADYLAGPPSTADCDPERYVFWDRVHPTTKVHRMIAERVFASVAERWKLAER